MTSGDGQRVGWARTMLRGILAATGNSGAVPRIDEQQLRRLIRPDLKAPKAVFREKGWRRDETRPNNPARQWFVKEIGDVLLCGSFDALEVTDGVSVTMLVSKSSQRLNRIVPILWPDEGRVFIPVDVRNFTIRVPKSQPEFRAAVADLLDKVAHWAEAEAMDDLIARAVVERPDGHATRQELHVLALAATGDWQTLSDYKDRFAKGQRMNFVADAHLGAMTAEILDRAWSHAVDVSVAAGGGGTPT